MDLPVFGRIPRTNSEDISLYMNDPKRPHPGKPGSRPGRETDDRQPNADETRRAGIPYGSERDVFDETRRAAPAHGSAGRGGPVGAGAPAGRTPTDRPAGADPSRRPPQLPPEYQDLARDFKKRLRGKPTHAWRKRSLLGNINNAFLFFLKIAGIVLLTVLFLLGGFGGGMLVGYISTSEPVTTGDLFKSDAVQTTFVYDEGNNVIAKLKGSDNVDRVTVAYSDVKNTYIDEAITSIEDERFYEHNGIDVQRIGSAVLSALLNGGSASHGGSTITQQTVKMISGNDQRSAQRKVQEWFKAMQLEQSLSKDDIMEYYVNLAPMGNNYVGIQAAAQNYFGKDAKDLNLAECAFLAGIPKSPSYYNPLRESGKRNAMRRQRVVLSKMYELGKITYDQYENALNTELVFKQKTDSTTAVNSYFVDYAVSEVVTDLMAQRNISKNLAISMVYSKGYKIYTTEDPSVQSALDASYVNRDLFQTNPEAIEDFPEKPQSGSAVIDVSDGSIAALQGGYGTKNSNLVLNRATDIARQPGSSIKPLIDYAPALEAGIITPATLYSNERLNLDPANPGTPWPKNSDGTYGGSVTIREAIRRSLNVVAVQVWDDLNARQNGLPLLYLSDVGIDRTTEIYPSTAIGGFNVGMSPLEMAAAYATFANNGVYREPYAYTMVLDKDGNVVLDKTKSIVSRTVYSPQVCFVLTDMLKGVITGGTASGYVKQIQNAQGETIDVAGKTGTTDDNLDKWFCGYTPYFAASTWYGYDNRLSRQEITVKADRNNAMRIWNDYMQVIHTNLPGKVFEKPDGVVQLTVCTQSGNLATDFCKAAGTAVTDYFIEGDALTPTTPCTLHVAPTPTPEVPAVSTPAA